MLNLSNSRNTLVNIERMENKIGDSFWTGLIIGLVLGPLIYNLAINTQEDKQE